MVSYIKPQRQPILWIVRVFHSANNIPCFTPLKNVFTGQQRQKRLITGKLIFLLNNQPKV